MTQAAAVESQTTPVILGTDIFKIGHANEVAGPGEQTEQATPAPAGSEEHPGEAIEEGGPPSQEDPARPEVGKEGGPPSQEAPARQEAGKPRFKDHAAAEDGYRNLQSKATKAEQEAAELRKRLSDYEAQQAAARAKDNAGAMEAAIDQYTYERNEKALEAIEALDPDDPDHRKKVARIWADAHKDIRRYSAQPVGGDGQPIIQPESAAEASRRAAIYAAQNKAPDGLPPTATSAQPASAPDEIEQRRTQIREYIDDRARKAGIEPNEDELWIGVSLTTPNATQDGKNMSIDEQIDWTINRYNERKAAIQARARQAAALPLGEGGNPQRPTAPQSAETAPMSLGDAIAMARERRRI